MEKPPHCAVATPYPSQTGRAFLNSSPSTSSAALSHLKHAFLVENVQQFLLQNIHWLCKLTACFLSKDTNSHALLAWLKVQLTFEEREASSVSCSPGKEAHCSFLYCRQRCKTETWTMLKSWSWKFGFLYFALLLFIFYFDAEIFTDPGKASEQYPGNPGQVVRAEEGKATNNKTAATVNTRAIFPARNVWGDPSERWLQRAVPCHWQSDISHICSRYPPW